MDASKLNTRAYATRGTFYHLMHPGIRPAFHLYQGEGADKDGRLVDVSKPHEKIGIELRGIEAKEVKAAFLKLVDLQRVAGANLDTPEVRAALLEFLQKIVIRFVNLEKPNGDEIGTSLEDLNWFIELSDNFGQQIINFASDTTNFFEKSSAS